MKRILATILLASCTHASELLMSYWSLYTDAAAQTSYWTPLNLGTNLVLWLDGTDSSTMFEDADATIPATNGSYIALWRDKSGNNRHATQSNSGRRCVYNSTAWFGSKPAMMWPLYNSNTNHFSTTTFSVKSWIFCLKYKNGYETTWGYDYPSIFSGQGAIYGLLGNTAASATWFANCSFPNARTNGYSVEYSIPTTTGLPLKETMLQLSWTNSISGLWLIGCERSTLNPRGWSGAYADVVALNGDLTTDERQNLEGYLAWKNDTYMFLPVDHPYRFTGAKFGYYTTAWTPKNIPSLQLWLDSTDTTTLFRDANGTLAATNNGAVMFWKDKSGQNNNATNGTSATSPTLSPNSMNAKSGVLWPLSVNSQKLYIQPFSAQDWFFTTTYYDGITNLFTSDYNTLLSGASGLIGLQSGTSGSTVWSGSSTFSGIRKNGGNEVSSSSSTNLPLNVDILHARRSAGSTSPSSWWQIGLDRDIGSRGWQGLFGEIFAFSSPLSTNDRQRVEGYLAWKWGQNLSVTNTIQPREKLSVFHPYRYNGDIFGYTNYWTPRDLGTNVLNVWLDASDASTINVDANNNMLNWSDKSGWPGRGCYATSNFVMYTNSYALHNGYPAVYYTNAFGTYRMLISSNFPTATVCSQQFYIVSNRLGTNTTFAGAYDGLSGFGARILGNINANGWYASSSFTGVSYKNGETTNSVPLPMPMCLLRFDGGTASLSTYNLFNQSWPGIVDRNFHGGVSEFVSTKIVLPDADRQKVEGYLAHKYQLQGNLPSNHPYKNRPPYAGANP